jgi:peptidyl-prolyl cis-trans isomerase C/foldase protein PrsA
MRTPPEFVVAGLLLAFSASAGCQAGGGSSPTVVSVNGRQIGKDQFERFLKTKTGIVGTAEESDLMRSQMLDEFIKRNLVLADAARTGLSVSPSEIDQAAEENPHLKSTVQAADTREELAADLLVEKYYRNVVLKDVRVAPEEIESYIQQNQARLTDKPGYYVREIRVQAKQEAEKLRREVVEGRRDFASVARLHSDAPTAADGGLSRYEEGQLPAPLETAISPLGPGDISQIVESGYGFHIFKLERRIQPYSPEEKRSRLDDRRRELAQEFVERRNQQAVEKALEQLCRDAAIRIDDSALGFTYSGSLRHN